jgi:sporulation protein YlmC with PRC-barrel domain
MWRGAAMPAFDIARRWKGRVVLDRTGDKLGSVVDVFYDAEDDEPGWALLSVADVGVSTRLVPIAEAVEDGNELRVPYDRVFVEGAPGMEPGGRLWPQEEAELYAYYGLDYTGASMADLEEDDDEEAAAVAQIRGLPPA